MALYKHKIDFDPADSADHDRIGSFIVGAAGEVVTVTDLGGGVLALDVNVANVVLDADSGVFAEDAAATSGDKGQSVLLVRQDTLAISTSADADYGNFKGTDKGELYVHDSDVLAMLTTIESDLDAVNVSLVAINSDTTAILADTATIDSNLASLVKAEDAAAGNGYNGIAMFGVRDDAGAALVGADGDFSAHSLDSRSRMRVNDAQCISWQVTAVSVGTSAVQLDGTPLATRTKCTIQNLGDKPVYVKNANTVTTSNGLMIPKFSERDLPYSAALPVWAISTAAAQDVRFAEAG